MPESPSRPSLGPFITAALSTALSAGMLIAFWLGMKLTLIKAFAIFIPAMTFAAMLIAISMGWIFVAMGRYHQRPRWIAGTAVFITITMIELMILTYIAGSAKV